MSTVIKPNVTTSVNDTADSWKDLNPTRPQALRQEIADRRTANIERANASQERAVSDAIAQRPSDAGTRRDNPNLTERPAVVRRDTGKTNTEQKKVVNRDGTERAKQQIRNRQDKAAEQYVDAQKAGRQLNNILQTMPRTVDAGLDRQDAAFKTRNDANLPNAQTTYTKAQSGRAGVPIDGTNRSEAGNFQRFKPADDKKHRGPDDNKEAAKGRDKTGSVKGGAETAQGVGQNKDIPQRGIVLPDGRKNVEGEDRGPAEKRNADRTVKRSQRGRGAQRTYRSNETADEVMTGLDNIYAGTTGNEYDAGPAEPARVDDKVKADITSPSEGDWRPIKETFNAEDPNFERVRQAHEEHTERVIKPRREKISKDVDRYAQRPLSGRIDIDTEIADTAEKIKYARDLMKLLVMQMNNRKVASGEGIHA